MPRQFKQIKSTEEAIKLANSMVQAKPPTKLQRVLGLAAFGIIYGGGLIFVTYLAFQILMQL